MHDPQDNFKPSAIEPPAVISCRGHSLDFSKGAVVMGILNVTPDSFYDGGKYLKSSEALRYAEQMLREGAQIIDVGGASSRPRGKSYGAGAALVSVKDEIDRVVPVIDAIQRSFPDAIISVDTFSSEVALAALDAGAHMINDVSGLQNGTASAKYAAEAGAAYVIMHSMYERGNLVHTADHHNVVTTVYKMLKKSAAQVQELGVNSIIIDPGFGFGKQHADNLQLIDRLDLLMGLRYPVLVGISRKSTVGQILSDQQAPVPAEDRLFGSLGMTAVAVFRGANIIRTHDVRETREMILGLEAVLHVLA